MHSTITRIIETIFKSNYSMNNSKHRGVSKSRFFFQISLLVLLGSCSNLDETLTSDEIIEDESPVLSDSWICDMKSFEEDNSSYIIELQDNGDYLAIGAKRILKVSKDGMLESNVSIAFPDDDRFALRVFNDKIFRFHYDNDFQDFDPNQPVELQIYDFDFNLLGEHILDSKGLIYDVEIESENIYGMLIYVPDQGTTLKKIDLNSGLISEIKLVDGVGTSPTNLHIAESGEYFCTDSGTRDNFFMLDNDFNLLVEKEYNQYLLTGLKYVPGVGIYISGSAADGPNWPFTPTFLALLDLDGNIINSVEYDAGDRWQGPMQINDERIFLMQTEPESQKNMLLSILDYDLNVINSIVILGNKVQSNIVVNEIGSFSFIFGLALDPDNTDLWPPSRSRLFKFDNSYELPTHIIEQ